MFWNFYIYFILRLIIYNMITHFFNDKPQFSHLKNEEIELSDVKNIVKP